ncbi:Lrp/AsnC family transcriptional regulator [Streptomyces sp. NBC_01012]|uniref:Lrp/AsnC family transcriptional regulator n=1 Tax=Streptomyces sp. NBC_01012 TaxID=2903717 RepID=UPI00386B8D04|nr:AsnC family transcriptional regulator [Streptomyces sp. NBC_01012]
MVDPVDTQILHSLQISPRAPFRLISEVAGVSEQTVARRFQALRRRGVVRVVGLVDPAVHGRATWVARVTCRPDRVDAIADALTRRSDVSHAHLATGGAEIICTLTAPFAENHGPDLLPRRLQRSSGVLGVDMSLLLHAFRGPWAHWTGFGPPLSAEAVALLTAHDPRPEPRLSPDAPGFPDPHGFPDPPDFPVTPIRPKEEDQPLLAALAEDGRASHARLAELTGWSTSRVARRMETLVEAGSLYFDVDLLSQRLGWNLQATLWLRTPPARLHQVGSALGRHPEVAFSGAIAGEHNLMAIVICTGTQDFYRYLTTRLAAVTGIDSYTVSIRVHHLKQATSVINQGRLVYYSGGA